MYKASRCLRSFSRRLSVVAQNFNAQNPVILGIETSCDDTGAAIVNGAGQILGQALSSQLNEHLRFGKNDKNH